jgi:PleD family two-component response regulator
MDGVIYFSGMAKKILVLDDKSEHLAELIRKLTAFGYRMLICSTPDHALDQISAEEPHLLIAAGEFADMNAAHFAEKAYQVRSIPAFVILDSAGDRTQLRMRRHPGVIGMYYKPLDVTKIFNRVVKFLQK